MIISTINKDRISTISLPQKVTGQYWLTEETDNGSERLVSVEGINGEWVLKSNRRVKVVTTEGEQLKSAVVEPLKVYTLIKVDTKERSVIYTEPATDDRQIFTKYLVTDDLDLMIGRAKGNDICYEAKVVSSNQATLSYRQGRWFIRDDKSANGTFVNQKRVNNAEVFIGDTVFIMGLKIIISKYFIAINNPDGKVSVTGKLPQFVNQEIIPANEDEEYELAEPDFFYRSPRFKRDIEEVEFKIDSPPQSPVSEEMPMVLVMGSSMAMGMMSCVTLANAIMNKNIMSMVMGGSMLVGTMLLPNITKAYEKKRKQKKEELRQKKYREYLDSVRLKIDDECRLQEVILRENGITIRDCEDRINLVQRNLWERSQGQNDFLHVRLGRGEGKLNANISYQEKRFSINEDNLEEELYMLCEAPKILHDIPITISLFDDYVSGIIGPRDQVKEFAKGIIIQLAALYSYDEVKFVFLFDEEEEKDFEFVKWLPHVWTDDNKFRFVANNGTEIKEVSAYLENIINERAALNGSEIEDVSPQYIIFSMSRELGARAEMIKQVLSKKENLHISVVTFYDELRNLPKECSKIVEVNNGRGRLFDRNDISGKSTEFIPDIQLSTNPLDLSIRLSNISLNSLANNFKLPKMITFLEMFGVGKVEHLNSLTRWKENDPTKSLEAAVGVDTLGELFKLDLHEKFHGPHGLVAGMTGSGKSEFIITYILSLAVNYHPNEVAFILIDYKGGGMAKSFENLPHTAGIITNLDGAAIKRSLVSIESELKRRQAIFGEASKKVGVSNIDIYKYQKLYREGTVTEPLQHLFIISDEFAELKTQQPEFMTQLVSAARIGRSLGVHLILATQKPSGVVDDQIWSNSKFRVCLKVQERADSMDMLKRPDAAELTDTGRFYLQVGYNELFELGQSSWAGAPYYPSDIVQKEKDDSVAVIDKNGHIIREVKIDHKKGKGGNAKKQLDVITDYLRKIADEENIKVRPLWCEPIPAVILLDDIRKESDYTVERYKLNPLIGKYDDPAHQRQCELRLPISEEGNVVVYGAAGCGKTTFLNALVFSLMQEHTPDEVNIYLLDFASETLRAFAKAPHVGDVILSYEAEKISNLFKMLLEESKKRKKLFADYGGDYASYIKTSGNKLPSIVVAINNFAAFTETYEEKEEAVTFLTREGTKYGIYFVLTSLGTNGVRFRLLQNFKQLLTMQLNDEGDYSSVVGKTEGLFPSKHKGCGLVKRDALYEFQTASLTTDEVPFGFIQETCAEFAKNWNGEGAKKIPILPEVVDEDFLKDYVNTGRKNYIPIGVEKNTLNVHYYPFGENYINLVLSAGNYHQKFLADIGGLIGRYYGTTGYIFDLDKKVTDNITGMKIAVSSEECETAVDELYNLVLYRNNTYKDAMQAGTECEKFEDVVVIISSITALKGCLSEDGVTKLGLILLKGTLDYNVVIIMGENPKSLTGVSYEQWYKNKVSPADGIWIGNGITEQYQLKAAKTTAEMREDITQEFGYSIVKGRCVKVKLLGEKMEGDNNDE